MKRKFEIIITILSIFLLTFTWLILYSYFLTPKVYKYTSEMLKKVTYQILNDEILTELNDDDLKNLLIFSKNDKQEILLVDYNVAKTYKINKVITNSLNKKMLNIDQGKNVRGFKVKSGNDGFLLFVPFFISSNSALFSSFGPLVPIKVMTINNIETNLKTNVTAYGLNNSLAQLYVKIKVNESIVTPVGKDDISLDYDILLASTLVSGRVPNYYGGEITKESGIY
jgi:sporulation protein YunB